MINIVEKKYLDGVFSNYKMTKEDGTVWQVPLDPANTDYQAIQDWIADGNSVIDPNAE